MNQKASNTALVVAGIAIILLVGMIFYEIFRTKPVVEESGLNNLVKDPNSGLENILNDLYSEDENEADNGETEETDEPEEKKEEGIKKPEATTQGQTNSKKEDLALQKAKDKYGTDPDVYFSVDAIDTDGRYIVSVHELETTIMITSYAVDVDKGTIVEQP